jgi:hypothetical protein
MFRHSRTLLLLFLAISAGQPVRGDGPPPRPKILEERPCGPDAIRGPLRFLLFQGCAGADFRDACRRHDACYDTIGSNRHACDRTFLEEMLTERPKSKHPFRARYRAHFAYLGVKLGGKGAWKSAQELARKLTGQ